MLCVRPVYFILMRQRKRFPIKHVHVEKSPWKTFGKTRHFKTNREKNVEDDWMNVPYITSKDVIYRVQICLREI